MTTVPQPSINLSCRTSIFCLSLQPTKISPFNQKKLNFRPCCCKLSFPQVSNGKDGILMKDEGLKRKRRDVVVRSNMGFGGGGGGGRRDVGATARLVGNIALAIGLAYLSMTGQLRWILDAIVSIWLIAVIVPIVGLGAFIWWAGRDIVQGTCPNCGNEFQIFKSTINEELQLCPFCSQPFAVVEDKFVREPVKFSNQTTARQEFTDSSSRSKKEKVPSTAVLDIEAEIKDAD